MPEGDRDHVLSAGAEHASGLRILHPGFDDVGLVLGERAGHRPVVRGDDAFATTDLSGEGGGLRGGERPVPPGPMTDVAFLVPAPEPTTGSVRDLSREYVLEYVRVDGTFEPKCPGAFAKPSTDFLMRGIVPRAKDSHSRVSLPGQGRTEYRSNASVPALLPISPSLAEVHSIL